jgi:DNA-directed RNA polymerase specialized sigma24 family protein
MDVVKLASVFDVDVAELLDYNETITPLLEIQLINKEVEEFTNSSYDSSSLETRKSILSKFLSSRSQTDNTIFLDRYLFMKPYTEIARELNMNENAIRTRLSRLRKTLNKYLKEKENDY